MPEKNTTKQPGPKQVDRRISIRFSARDQELFDFLFFGQPEDLSKFVKRALYAYTGIPGGDYLGQPVSTKFVPRPIHHAEQDAKDILSWFLTELVNLRAK